MSIPSLRKSKISNFIPIMSNVEVIQQLLSPQDSARQQTSSDLMLELFSQENINKLKTLDTSLVSDSETQQALNDVVTSILVTTFHSLSLNINFTKEILDHICSEVFKELTKINTKIQTKASVVALQEVIIDQIGEYIKIVHEDYNICFQKTGSGNAAVNKKLSDTNFSIKKDTRPIKLAKKKKQKQYYKHRNQFGILGHTITGRRTSKRAVLSKEIIKTGNPKFTSRNKIFNTSEIVSYKLKNTDDQSTSDIGLYLNKVKNGELDLRDDKSCSLSFIMMNNPSLRVGTKNSLELSTFLHSLSTIELSKCLPFLDVKFILPSDIETKSNKVFQTSSITQFLNGTPITRSDKVTTPFYRELSANFVRDSEGDSPQRAVETNLSAFTMPQTVNNFDELYVGHSSSYAKGIKGNTKQHILFKRNNTVHDYTKPYLTIKSFNIDVAPTQGLMSFKTGRLSIVLHDKSRMSEIAPFIKPDLFGSFGAEIAIEYGWSHMDAIKKENLMPRSKPNYFAQFLDENKIYEKYIITNSSYTIDKNGQVNIDLAIAMKGPVSIRAINFESDMPRKIEESYVDGLKRRAESTLNDIKSHIDKRNEKTAKLPSFVSIGRNSQILIDNLVKEFKSNLDVTKKARNVDYIKGTIKANDKVIKKIKNATGLEKLREIGSFFEKLQRGGFSIRVMSDGSSIKKLSSLTDDDFDDVDDYLKIVNRLYQRIIRLARAANTKITRARKKQSDEIESLLQKITDGLSIEDPFFDLENYSNVEEITDSNINNTVNTSTKNLEYMTSIVGIDAEESSSSNRLTDYVSLGNIILAVLGSHLAFTRSYDEIQIVSYTLNGNAGLAMHKNVASLLVDKNELKTFLTDIFQNGAQYTLESLLTQIIKKFITTRYCVNYGMRDFYRLNDSNQVEVKDEKKKPEEIKKEIDERLEEIYNLLYKGGADDNSFLKEIKFIMPKIKLTFDTVTTKESKGLDTILRISLFDRNDNPFNAISDIMNKVYEKGVHDAVRDINKRLIELKALKKKDKNYSKHKQKFFAENKKILDKLIQGGFLKLEQGEYIVNTKGSHDFTTIKEQLKSFMPSINYGSNNSGIIDASISTINEAKLNTVYLTRPGRNESSLKTRVRFAQDLPLRILPSQVNLTMFGCPYVNFAQYIFLDFETGTTIDNQYAVTGIKHEITPGKFTTSLTLAYGDAYGKYETVVDTLSRTVNERFDSKKEKSKKDIQQTYKFDMETKKSNMDLLKIDKIDTVLNEVTIHEITDQLKDITLNDRDEEGIPFRPFDQDQSELFNEFEAEIIQPVEREFLKSIYYKESALTINIREIKFISIQEKYQAFYKIKVYENKRDKSYIDFEKLILALPDDVKQREKTYYISLKEKVLKDKFFDPVRDFFKRLRAFSDPVINKIVGDNNLRINDNKGLFLEILIKQNLDLFFLLLEMYTIPILKINIKPVEAYTQLSIENKTIEFDIITYNDLDGEAKEKINKSYASKIKSALKTNKFTYKGTKRRRSRNYNLSCKSIEITSDNKVHMTLLHSYKRKSKKDPKKLVPATRQYKIDLTNGLVKGSNLLIDMLKEHDFLSYK